MTRTLIAALTVSAATGMASAGVAFVSETFDYPDGNLVGNGGWTAHSGAGNLPVQVAGGAAVLNQGPNSREDVNLQFPAASTGQTVYAGFDFTNSGDAQSVYFAHLMVGATTNFGSRLWIAAPGLGGDYAVGYSDSSTAPTGGQLWSSDLTFGAMYRAIMAYNFDTGTSQLWINAATEGDASISVAGIASRAYNGFALRQAGTGSTQTIDNLIVGDSFAAVVPAPGAIALLGLGGLAAVRRRRA